MRILHSAMMFDAKAGILQQMRWEQAAAGNLGIDWDCRVFGPANDGERDSLLRSPQPTGSNPLSKRWDRIFRVRREYYRWLSGLAGEYDALLLRHVMADPLEALFIRSCPTPVFTVHHTLEVPELAGLGSTFNRIKAGVETISGAASVRASYGVIGVTREIADYEVRRARVPLKSKLVYPNGVMITSPVDDSRSTGVPEFVFVAARFSPWHGLDLLLDAAEQDSSECIVHLVGSLDSESAVRAARDQRFRIHGTLDKGQLQSLYARAWLGLSSFALSRNGMFEACTLKVREYLSSGVSVYAGHHDVFPESFAAYRTGPARLSSIIEYARSVRDISRIDVASSAEPYISKTALLENLHDHLATQLGKRIARTAP